MAIHEGFIIVSSGNADKSGTLSSFNTSYSSCASGGWFKVPRGEGPDLQNWPFSINHKPNRYSFLNRLKLCPLARPLQRWREARAKLNNSQNMCPFVTIVSTLWGPFSSRDSGRMALLTPLWQGLPLQLLTSSLKTRKPYTIRNHIIKICQYLETTIKSALKIQVKCSLILRNYKPRN